MFHWKGCCSCPSVVLLSSQGNIPKSVNNLHEGHAPALGLVEELRANTAFLIPFESALIPYPRSTSAFLAVSLPLQSS